MGLKNAELSQSAMFKDAENKREYLKALAGLNTTNAGIYGNLAGAALSGINTLASKTEAT